MKRQKELTEEECLAIGGHCWVEEKAWKTEDLPDSGEIRVEVRYCKHCRIIERKQPEWVRTKEKKEIPFEIDLTDSGATIPTEGERWIANL